GEGGPVTYDFMRGAVRFLCRTFLAGRFQIRGRDRIPPQGAYVVCANHIGTVDPVVLPAWVNRSDSWSMAKAEALEKPGFGAWVLRSYHAFGVVRHSADRRALRRAREILASGGVLFIYPEGHRAWDGRLQRAEPGAAFLARAAGVPVLPIAVVGSNRIIEKGRLVPRPRPLTVHVGFPFRLRGRRADGSKVSNQEAADAVMIEIARLLPEEMRGVYAERMADPALEGLSEPLGGVVAAGS
ncbi:MAG: lysophospholipid acyltransferase family protein, partial [Candidatus Dormibacteraceae bacterium]